MAYDEDLANRIRDLLADEPDITEKKMFGGLAFLADGKMAIAVSGKGGLMVRVDPSETDALVAQPGVQPMQMRGRPMDGWVRVSADAVQAARDLKAWAERGLTYARSLPPKA